MDLREEINSSDGLQSSAAISNDGNTIFIVSERKEGFGGRDIYYAEKNSDGSGVDQKYNRRVEILVN